MNTKNSDLILREELANSITHGFGMLFGIVSIPILIATATHSGNTAAIVGASVYGFCFLMLFTFSTLYHGFQHPKVKHTMMIMDHISIYFLIAGSYTPFILLFLNNKTGLTLLTVLWSLTLLGIVFKILFAARFNFVHCYLCRDGLDAGRGGPYLLQQYSISGGYADCSGRRTLLHRRTLLSVGKVQFPPRGLAYFRVSRQHLPLHRRVPVHFLNKGAAFAFF